MAPRSDPEQSEDSQVRPQTTAKQNKTIKLSFADIIATYHQVNRLKLVLVVILGVQILAKIIN